MKNMSFKRIVNFKSNPKTDKVYIGRRGFIRCKMCSWKPLNLGQFSKLYIINLEANVLKRRHFKKIYKLFCEKIIHIVWRFNLYLIIICEVGRRVNIMPIL